MGLGELIASWVADRRIRRLMHGAPARALRDVEEGRFVRVTGKVCAHRGEVIEAPLSGRQCAYYSLVVRARVDVVPPQWRVTRTERNQLTRTIFDKQDGVLFELEAEGARAVIDPANAWISSGFDHQADLSDPRALAAFVRFGLAGSAERPRFQEAVLGIGERIALYGAAVLEPDPDDISGEHGYRDGARMRLRFTGTDRFPLVIRDDLESL